jgi:predicted deacylase
MSLSERTWFSGAAGTKEGFLLRVGEMPNSAPYLIPVLVVNGGQTGPTFFINATMHGDEVLGADIVRRCWSLLDPQELSGRLIAIPMANFAGVATRTRRNIVEMYPGPQDMNRIFPGNPVGIMTERLAATIMERFVAIADFTFDVHCASVGGEWQAYTQIPAESDGLSPELTAEARALGKVFGTSLVLEGMDTPGSLGDEVLRAGKTASMVEFGVANRSEASEREFGSTGLRNLLTHVGMLAGTVEPPPDQVIVRDLIRVRTDRGGFLDLLVRAGDQVEEGQLVARVTDIDTEVLQEFHAPASGLICRINTMAVVGTGDLIVYVGR